MRIVLSVADHDQNGFISIVQWSGLTEDEARRIIGAIDAQISYEEEPDIKTASFTFILDLMDGYDQVDTGKRFLPTQTATAIAPIEVQRWLNERPNPDAVMHRQVPNADLSALRRAAGL